MSKRHQASRRKVYGRRQHELRERVERRPLSDQVELLAEAFEPGSTVEEHGLFGLGLGGRRLGFALGD
ncbi:MAG: hypothetical protein ACOYXS_07050 [Chloroflexota bacterium]